jgi:hypothetical protein
LIPESVDRYSGSGSIALLLILPSTFYLLGSIYPPSTLSLLFPRPAPPPLRADSEEGRAYTAKLEQELQSLPIVKEMRGMTVKPDGSEGEWYETREYPLNTFVDVLSVVPQVPWRNPFILIHSHHPSSVVHQCSPSHRSHSSRTTNRPPSSSCTSAGACVDMMGLFMEDCWRRCWMRVWDGT